MASRPSLLGILDGTNAPLQQQQQQAKHKISKQAVREQREARGYGGGTHGVYSGGGGRNGGNTMGALSQFDPDLVNYPIVHDAAADYYDDYDFYRNRPVHSGGAAAAGVSPSGKKRHTTSGGHHHRDRGDHHHHHRSEKERHQHRHSSRGKRRVDPEGDLEYSPRRESARRRHHSPRRSGGGGATRSSSASKHGGAEEGNDGEVQEASAEYVKKLEQQLVGVDNEHQRLCGVLMQTTMDQRLVSLELEEQEVRLFVAEEEQKAFSILTCGFIRRMATINIRLQDNPPAQAIVQETANAFVNSDLKRLIEGTQKHTELSTEKLTDMLKDLDRNLSKMETSWSHYKTEVKSVEEGRLNALASIVQATATHGKAETQASLRSELTEYKSSIEESQQKLQDSIQKIMARNAEPQMRMLDDIHAENIRKEADSRSKWEQMVVQMKALEDMVGKVQADVGQAKKASDGTLQTLVDRFDELKSLNERVLEREVANISPGALVRTTASSSSFSLLHGSGRQPKASATTSTPPLAAAVNRDTPPLIGIEAPTPNTMSREGSIANTSRRGSDAGVDGTVAYLSPEQHMSIVEAVVTAVRQEIRGGQAPPLVSSTSSDPASVPTPLGGSDSESGNAVNNNNTAALATTTTASILAERSEKRIIDSQNQGIDLVREEVQAIIEEIRKVRSSQENLEKSSRLTTPAASVTGADGDPLSAPSPTLKRDESSFYTAPPPSAKERHNTGVFANNSPLVKSSTSSTLPPAAAARSNNNTPSDDASIVPNLDENPYHTRQVIREMAELDYEMLAMQDWRQEEFLNYCSTKFVEMDLALSKNMHDAFERAAIQLDQEKEKVRLARKNAKESVAAIQAEAEKEKARIWAEVDGDREKAEAVGATSRSSSKKSGGFLCCSAEEAVSGSKRPIHSDGAAKQKAPTTGKTKRNSLSSETSELHTAAPSSSIAKELTAKEKLAAAQGNSLKSKPTPTATPQASSLQVSNTSAIAGLQPLPSGTTSTTAGGGGGGVISIASGAASGGPAETLQQKEERRNSRVGVVPFSSASPPAPSPITEGEGPTPSVQTPASTPSQQQKDTASVFPPAAAVPATDLSPSHLSTTMPGVQQVDASRWSLSVSQSNPTEVTGEQSVSGVQETRQVSAPSSGEGKTVKALSPSVLAATTTEDPDDAAPTNRDDLSQSQQAKEKEAHKPKPLNQMLDVSPTEVRRKSSTTVHKEQVKSSLNTFSFPVDTPSDSLGASDATQGEAPSAGIVSPAPEMVSASSPAPSTKTTGHLGVPGADGDKSSPSPSFNKPSYVPTPRRKSSINPEAVASSAKKAATNAASSAKKSTPNSKEVDDDDDEELTFSDELTLSDDSDGGDDVGEATPSEKKKKATVSEASPNKATQAQKAAALLEVRHERRPSVNSFFGSDDDLDEHKDKKKEEVDEKQPVEIPAEKQHNWDDDDDDDDDEVAAATKDAAEEEADPVLSFSMSLTAQSSAALASLTNSRAPSTAVGGGAAGSNSTPASAASKSPAAGTISNNIHTTNTSSQPPSPSLMSSGRPSGSNAPTPAATATASTVNQFDQSDAMVLSGGAGGAASSGGGEKSKTSANDFFSGLKKPTKGTSVSSGLGTPAGSSSLAGSSTEKKPADKSKDRKARLAAMLGV